MMFALAGALAANGAPAYAQDVPPELEKAAIEAVAKQTGLSPDALELAASAPSQW